MSTVLSTLNSSTVRHGVDHDRRCHGSSQTYSEIFFDNAPSSDKTLDFDLFIVIVNAVNTVKTRPVITLPSKNTKIPNFKNPCGICLKSVNKNQKAIFCNACFKWIHRKCNWTSLTEYDTLVLEDDDIPRQCILCEIADMASKFPFGYPIWP